MGGGVEFGEHSIDALQREFQEEIQAELTNIKYLACLENIFVFNGQTGHELIQLYQCEFVEPKFYQLESLAFADGEWGIYRTLDADRALSIGRIAPSSRQIYRLLRRLITQPIPKNKYLIWENYT